MQSPFDGLARAAARRNAMTVDLQMQEIMTHHDHRKISFSIDARRREALLQGLDPVGFTLQGADDIRTFEHRYHEACPWLA